ncbi:MAG: tautomerase family protein [Candidatus Bathyarchaeia archaeon]
MPIVHIFMLGGKTLEQKRAIAKGITDVICKSIDVNPDLVIIQMVELPSEDVSVGGVLEADKQAKFKREPRLGPSVE